jgi:hypothetical protein
MPPLYNARRDALALTHELGKRNWASEEAGVIVVFCIVFLVGVGLIALCVHKWLVRRRLAAAAKN